MTIPPLAIRADGGAGIGAGHVMRCLALADAWKRRGGSVEWFSAALPPLLEQAVAARGIPAHVLADGGDWTAPVAWASAHPSAWIVVDGYGFCGGPAPLRRAGARVLVIDDDGRWGQYDCDIVLNQNPSAADVAYRTAARRLLGTSFVLLRDEFLRQSRPQRRFEHPAGRLFVSFGGHDARAAADRVVSLLTALTQDGLEVDVSAGVVGGRAHLAGSSRVTWHSSTDMSAVMRSADIALVAAGSVCWELAYFGVPMLTTIVADNQDAVSRSLQAAGASRDLGWYEDLDDESIIDAVRLLRDDPRREAMSACGRMLVDGAGAERVVDEMLRSAA